MGTPAISLYNSCHNELATKKYAKYLDFESMLQFCCQNLGSLAHVQRKDLKMATCEQKKGDVSIVCVVSSKTMKCLVLDVRNSLYCISIYSSLQI